MFLFPILALAAWGLISPPGAKGLSTTVVISQVYGGGGNSGAPFQNDFIELFNRGTSPVSVAGWSVQYSSSTGLSWQKTDLPSVTLQPGQYLLVREAAGTGCFGNPCGVSLPTPDASGAIAMSGTAGKVALVNTTTLLTGTGCPFDASVVDFVGYGAGTNCSETSPTATLSNATAALRNSNGCAETDNNSTDFTADALNPRNTASPVNSCAPPLPALTINDVTVTEGNSGTTTATFAVSLSAPAPAGGVTFDIATADNTATTANNDYVAKSLTGQTIAAGQSSYSFSVTVNGDTNVEPNESFFVNVTNVTNAVLSDGQGVGTILSDDIPPTLSINDVSVAEGNSGTVTANFTVSLATPALAGGVTFDIATADNTATTADNDYVAKSLSGQTIAAGQTSYAFSVVVNGDTNIEQNESFFVNVTNVTGATVGDGQGVGTIISDDLPPTLIHDIQGTGETPNLAGQIVTIRGIVVGDFQGSSSLNGFFVEEEQSDWDADANTSEGIFVFAPSAPNVNVGDNVTVIGTVLNFNGLTELSPTSSVTINSSGNTLPPAQTVTLPVPNSQATDLEKYEGMRVSFGTLYVTDNVDLGQFGELTLASSKLFVPTNSIDPNDNPASGNTTTGTSNAAAVAAQQSVNNRSRIILDDARSGSNLNPIAFIGSGTNATIRLGDSINNLAGVLSYGFGNYRVEPTGTVSFTAGNPRPAAPDAVGGSLKIASFNMENYFFTLATGRGADTATERDRQRDKLAAAIAGLNADIVGLIEVEKGTAANPNAAVNELIAKLNTLGAGVYALIPTPAAVYDAVNPVGTDTDIKSGMIYRVSNVTPVGAVSTDTAAAAGTYSRAPIAQTFEAKSNGSRFTVVVNHLRSKSCSGTPTGDDVDQGTGQGCFNGRRRLQAQALLSFINSTLVPMDPDVIAIGDFNAYTQEDPIDTLRAAGLTDLLAANQYSFTFDAQVGRLDHAFATASFASQITGSTIWHINADEPDVFDYNTENKLDDRYAPTPYRSADHDPVLLGVNPACPSIAIGPQILPGGTAGVAYNELVTATGGLTPHIFTISAGALPDGLSLSPGGTISGTPTKTGTFTFTVTATGGGLCTGSREYSINIGCSQLAVSPATIPNTFRGVPYSVTFTSGGGLGTVTFAYTGQRPPGITFNTATGVLSGTPTQSGNFAFKITAMDANGCMVSRDYVLAINATTLKLTDPAVCLGPGGVVAVEATVTNSAASPQAANFTAALGALLVAVQGSCTANTGVCTVTNSSSIAWTGTLSGGQTVTIRYNTQVTDTAALGTQACVTSAATVGDSAPSGVTACTTTTCAALGPGNALPALSPASDGRAGSVLIYNIYTSAADSNRQNTRFAITNIDSARAAYVHLFFVDGATCQIADSFLCLTAQQTTTFLASDLDPGTTGYVVAVAVDRNGCPINFNYLIGDEYVKFSSGHSANLAAESVMAIAGGLPACNDTAQTASLAFDGVSYSVLPHVLAADNIPSRADGNDTMLILNRIGGNLATSAASLGNVFGILYDDAETPVSFSVVTNACQLRGSISGAFPRTTPRFEQFVPAGRSGWMRMSVSGGTAAMTGVTINFNANTSANGGVFNQGHNLHALTTTSAMVYTIPIFPPSC